MRARVAVKVLRRCSDAATGSNADYVLCRCTERTFWRAERRHHQRCGLEIKAWRRWFRENVGDRFDHCETNEDVLRELGRLDD